MSKSMDLLSLALSRGRKKDIYQATVAEAIADRCDPWDTYWAAQTLIMALPDEALEALEAQLSLYVKVGIWPTGLIPKDDPTQVAFELAKPEKMP